MEFSLEKSPPRTQETTKEGKHKKKKKNVQSKHDSTSESEEDAPRFDNILGAIVHALVALATITTAIQPLLTQVTYHSFPSTEIGLFLGF